MKGTDVGETRPTVCDYQHDQLLHVMGFLLTLKGEKILEPWGAVGASPPRACSILRLFVAGTSKASMEGMTATSVSTGYKNASSLRRLSVSWMLIFRLRRPTTIA